MFFYFQMSLPLPFAYEQTRKKNLPARNIQHLLWFIKKLPQMAMTDSDIEDRATT